MDDDLLVAKLGLFMKIRFVMESVFALSFGMGMARWAGMDPAYIRFTTGERWDYSMYTVCEKTLAGTALILGLGTWTERFRGKSPSSWGIGRSLIAIARIFLLGQSINLIWKDVKHFYILKRNSGPNIIVIDDFRGNFNYNFLDPFACFAVAMCISEIAMKRTAGLAPADSREWTGRLFFATAVSVILWLKFAQTNLLVVMRRPLASSTVSAPAPWLGGSPGLGEACPGHRFCSNRSSRGYPGKVA